MMRWIQTWLSGSLLLGTAIFAAAASAQRPTGGVNLEVKITDAKSKEGQIIVALFTKSDGFPSDFAKAQVTKKVSLDQPACVFKELPAGTYVVVVAHDRNGNGKVEKSAIGIPKEPIGLSNHPKLGLTNRPNFEKAKIDLKQDKSIAIKLIDVGS